MQYQVYVIWGMEWKGNSTRIQTYSDAKIFDRTDDEFEGNQQPVYTWKMVFSENKKKKKKKKKKKG